MYKYVPVSCDVALNYIRKDVSREKCLLRMNPKLNIVLYNFQNYWYFSCIVQLLFYKLV